MTQQWQSERSRRRNLEIKCSGFLFWIFCFGGFFFSISDEANLFNFVSFLLVLFLTLLPVLVETKKCCSRNEVQFKWCQFLRVWLAVWCLCWLSCFVVMATRNDKLHVEIIWRLNKLDKGNILRVCRSDKNTKNELYCNQPLGATVILWFHFVCLFHRWPSFMSLGLYVCSETLPNTSLWLPWHVT